MAFTELATILKIPLWLLFTLLIITLWEAIWKVFGLWKSARNNHLWWFIAIILFNTVGILPIIYIYFFQKRKKKRR